SLPFDELNAKFNEDKFNPVDGKMVRAADHLSALLEAHLSIQHGITSKQLENGRKNLLKGYEKGSKINGIDVRQIFDDFIMED
ncbi:MAG: HD domain-containing protein, partial [Spirochaetia bacterium]|nr:HD domain-containing protein [Spirochaetia bacterium]